jgi:hypothetical protein
MSRQEISGVGAGRAHPARHSQIRCGALEARCGRSRPDAAAGFETSGVEAAAAGLEVASGVEARVVDVEAAAADVREEAGRRQVRLRERVGGGG